MLAVWAEMNVIAADQFRDGNVPALQEPLTVARRTFQALPEMVNEHYFRGDSSCYEKQLMEWLRNEERSEVHNPTSLARSAGAECAPSKTTASAR